MAINENPTQDELERVYTLVRALLHTTDQYGTGGYLFVAMRHDVAESLEAEEGVIVKELRRIVYGC